MLVAALTTLVFFFFFKDTAPPEISPLPLHDALPISPGPPAEPMVLRYVSPAGTSAYRPPPASAASVRSSVRSGSGTISGCWLVGWNRIAEPRSEEHTSELQSQSNLVCRLLLEKKKKK